MISGYSKVYQLLSNGTQEEFYLLQREAKPKWRDAVRNRDEVVILWPMKRELSEAELWLTRGGVHSAHPVARSGHAAEWRS